MKKKIIFFIICLIFLLVCFVTFKKLNHQSKNELKSIRVAEVTHSVFYAPLYVAIENGYFEDEGLDIELILTSGADKVASAVLSNDVEIGFAGAESAIYVYTGGENDYLQIFSGLTKRDGQFILGKKENKDFTLNDLVGKEVLVGRKGGMPALNFINALKNAGINPNDVKLNYSIDFASLSGAFVSGMGDYVNLFEPNATALEKQGYGYSVASIGLLSGEVPYTTFYARKSYIDRNEDTINSFRNAINKGLKYVEKNDEETIANVLLNQFPDTSKNDIAKIIKRHKDTDAWLNNSNTSLESFKNLEKIMIDNNLLDEEVPFEDLVVNKK